MTTKRAGQLDLTDGTAAEIVDGHLVPDAHGSTVGETAVVYTDMTPGQLLAVAVGNNADVDKLEKLVDLQERWEAGQARKAFNAAMQKVQAEIPPVFKDRENTHTRSTYSTYDAVHKAIVPVYTKYGFSVSHDETDSPHDGQTRFQAIVRHVGGHNEMFHIDLPLDGAGKDGKSNKTAIQAKVSSSTYAKRCLEMRIFGVACTGEDDDGNGGAAPEITVRQADEMAGLLRQLQDDRVGSFYEFWGHGSLDEFTQTEAAKALIQLRAAVRKLGEVVEETL